MLASGSKRKHLVYVESGNSDDDADDRFMRAPDDNIKVSDEDNKVDASGAAGGPKEESQMLKHVKRTLFQAVAKDDFIKRLLKTSCKEKCKKSNVFGTIVSSEEANWDVLFNTCSAADLKRILDVDFVKGYNVNDIEDKMNYLNNLPKQAKLKLISDIR